MSSSILCNDCKRASPHQRLPFLLLLWPRSSIRFCTCACYYHHGSLNPIKYIFGRHHFIWLPSRFFLCLSILISVSSARNSVFMFVHCSHHAEISSFSFFNHLHMIFLFFACAFHPCLPTVSFFGSLFHLSTSDLYSFCVYMWFRVCFRSWCFQVVVRTNHLSLYAASIQPPLLSCHVSWSIPPITFRQFFSLCLSSFSLTIFVRRFHLCLYGCF